MFQAPHATTQHTNRTFAPLTRKPRKISRRTTKIDPVIERLRQFETARRRYVIARKALDRIQKKNDKKLWETAGVGPNGSDMFFLGGFDDRWLTSNWHIDRWARARIAEAEADKDLPHRGGPARAVKCIRRVRVLRPLFKKELAKRQAIVAKSRKAIGWDVANAEHNEALNAYYRLMGKITDRRPQTMRGVLALLAHCEARVWAARYTEETMVAPAWFVEQALGKVRETLKRMDAKRR